MIVLVGESCSGKSSVQKELAKNYGFKRIVTYTTRPKRENEVNDRDYHFITLADFFELKMDDVFAEIGKYNGWMYGSAKADYNDETVAVLTPSGLRQLKDSGIKNIVSFYIKLPRTDRMIRSLRRGDNIEEAIRRNMSDVGQFDGVENEVDYVIEYKEYERTPHDIAEEIYLKHSDRMDNK